MLEYTLNKKKGLKRINLRVSSAGEVKVSAPLRTSKTTVDRFVAENKAWINERLKQASRFSLTDGSVIGRVKIVHKSDLASNYEYDTSTGSLCLDTKKLNAKEIVSSVIQDKASDSLTLLVKEVAANANEEVSGIFVKNIKSRWGSCSNKGNINLSRYVWFLPYNLRHYVVSHEVAHLKHLNHSKDFWSHLATLHPEYKDSKKEIKEYAGLLGCLG